ncbi:hypothetical protein J2W98_003823 [Paenibacillus peoriae]|uniref:Uncharacterized protein n=1 Tax=Paenibacillus peoriae TaxID=59893 RepID=A0ABU1QIS4_9BACL|nr:hypothetical protein [Paenibacillus peoriae]MDR6779543.1 hypothetical protein [Paenibacillus peoriae]
MNQYLVCFKTKTEWEVGLVVKIDVSVNRPNNPSDDEIINDYLKLNYGESIDYETLQCHVLSDVIHIDQDYCVET